MSTDYSPQVDGRILAAARSPYLIIYPLFIPGLFGVLFVSVGRSTSVAAKEQSGDKGPFVFSHPAFAPPHTGPHFVLWDL